MSRRVVLVAFLVLLALTAGCIGDDAGDSGGDDAGGAAGDGGTDGNDGASPGENGGDGGDGSADSLANAGAQQERRLIRTANLEVEVDDFETSRANLTAEAQARGGYMSSAEQETRERENETWTVGTVTYRVPSEEFDAFYAATTAEGNVTSATTDTEDVTDQLVDLEARLENLETQRDRLRGLYEDANETEDVLAVEERLSEVQEEIERLEAERASLEDRVAYSTVTVRLVEPEPDRVRAKTETDSWYETPITSAFLSSIGGVATTIRAIVVLAAYAAPYLLAFGAPIALFVGARRRLRGRSAESEDALAEAETDDSADGGRSDGRGSDGGGSDGGGSDGGGSDGNDSNPDGDDEGGENGPESDDEDAAPNETESAE